MNAADKTEGRDSLTQSIRFIQNSSKEEIVELGDLVLTDEKIVPFIELIEGLGQTLGLKTTIVSVNAEKADESKNSTKPTKIHVTVETDGPWSGSIGFINALENLPSHDLIESTSISKNTDNWHTASVITIYSFKQ